MAGPRKSGVQLWLAHISCPSKNLKMAIGFTHLACLLEADGAAIAPPPVMRVKGRRRKLWKHIATLAMPMPANGRQASVIGMLFALQSLHRRPRPERKKVLALPLSG